MYGLIDPRMSFKSGMWAWAWAYALRPAAAPVLIYTGYPLIFKVKVVYIYGGYCGGAE